MKLKELLYWIIFICVVIQVIGFFLGVPNMPEPWVSRYGD